jgi:hypothetical protein
MKRQTLFMLPALLAALAVSFIVLRTLPGVGSGALGRIPWRTESAMGLTLDVPAGASAARQDPGEPWSAVEFRDGILGTIRVAREVPQGDGNLQRALRDWFELPGLLEAPVTYTTRGQWAQARPVTAFGPSGHLLQRQGRLLVMVLVFDLDDHRYWVQARTAADTPEAVAGFHRVLRSLRGPKGEAPDPAMSGELAAAEAGLAPGMVRNLEWTRYLAFLPPAVMLLVFGIVSLVLAMGGRPPKGPEDVGNRYAEDNVEVGLVFRLSRKFFNGALRVAGDRLVVYTFGTPFLAVPLAGLAGRVTEKTGWFGPPYLELALDGRQEFRKYRMLYGASSTSIKLRLFTRDSSRLRVALGA